MKKEEIIILFLNHFILFMNIFHVLILYKCGDTLYKKNL